MILNKNVNFTHQLLIYYIIITLTPAQVKLTPVFIKFVNFDAEASSFRCLRGAL